MIAYLDSSALAKVYVDEEKTARVRKLISEAIVATSRLSFVEIASAFARRRREGDLSASQADRVLARLRQSEKSIYVVELLPRVAAKAQQLLLRHPLRAADSVQLASALVLRDELRKSLKFVAYDERLAKSASVEFGFGR